MADFDATRQLMAKHERPRRRFVLTDKWVYGFFGILMWPGFLLIVLGLLTLVQVI